MCGKGLTSEPIGILAAGGEVPVEVAKQIVHNSGSVFIVGIDANTSHDIAIFPHARISLGQLGKMLALFRQHHCRRLVIVGSLSRPDILKLRLDFGVLLNLPAVLSMLKGGDDQVLRRVVVFFEAQGFEVVGIPDVAPGLIADRGTLAGAEPTASEQQDAIVGYELIHKLGPLDIGQAVVIDDGCVRAIEGVDGTDAMLGRLVSAQASLVRRGTLIKAAKPGQELRVDLPTIGPATVAACDKAGLKRITVEAGRSVIVQRETTFAEANRTGIGVWGLPATVKKSAPVNCATPLQAANLACLTSLRAAEKHLADAVKGLAAIRVLQGYNAAPSVIVARQHILAVNVAEPYGAFIERAVSLRQWGGKGRHKREGLMVLSSLGGITGAHLKTLASARFAGLAIERGETVSHELLTIAEYHGLFIVEHA